MKPIVTFADFTKLDLRVGEVLEANEVEQSDKLIELIVDFGPAPDGAGLRKIYVGIKKWYEPSSLVGRKLMFVVNLGPKKFKIGDKEYESQGMMMAADGPASAQGSGGQSEAVLYSFDKDLPSGTIVR